MLNKKYLNIISAFLMTGLFTLIPGLAEKLPEAAALTGII